MTYTQGATRQEMPSPKSRLIALLLCWFLGVFGVHRFYLGRIGSGVLYLCTQGLWGIGLIVDLILIAIGDFRDDRGLRVTEWEELSSRQQKESQPVYQQPAQPTQPSQRTQPMPIVTDSGINRALYCQTCGSANEPSTTYCSSCGTTMEIE
ncbi:MAG: NINE protein [Candidatus Heimdallarchaeota archaeon]